MSNMQASGQGGKGNFDISSLAGTTLSLEDYLSMKNSLINGLMIPAITINPETNQTVFHMIQTK